MRCDIVECLLLAATTTATLYKAQTILFPFYLNFFPTKIVLLYIYIVYCLMIRKNVILLQLLLFGIYQDFFALLKFEPNNKPIEKKRHKKERKTIKINGFVLQSVVFYLERSEKRCSVVCLGTQSQCGILQRFTMPWQYQPIFSSRNLNKIYVQFFKFIAVK